MAIQHATTWTTEEVHVVCAQMPHHRTSYIISYEMLAGLYVGNLASSATPIHVFPWPDCFGLTVKPIETDSLPPAPRFCGLEMLTAKVFHVDADDDIVVGDTIIFTERLYVDRDGELLVPGGGVSSSSSSSNALAPTPQRSHPLHHQDFPATSSGAGCGSAPRVSLSMASLEYQTTRTGGKTGRERGATAAKRPSTRASFVIPAVAGSNGGGGEFVGERTVAAHVLQDSFRSMRRKERGGVLGYDR